MKLKWMLVSLVLAVTAQPSAAERLSGATIDWPPFYSESIAENGFFSAIVRTAFERAGYEVEPEFVPWQRALKSTQAGQNDVLWGAYYTAERAETLEYSDVIHQNNEVFIKNSGGDLSYGSLADLRPYEVGVIAGSAQAGDLRENGYENLSEVAENEINLKKLANGRLDLVLMGQAQFNFLMSEDPALQGLAGNLEVVDPPFKSYNLHIAVSKKRADSAEIIEKFNAALAEMRADGTFDAILERFGQS